MKDKSEGRKNRSRPQVILLAAALLALLCAGCAHSGAGSETVFTRVVTPATPVFLNGPAALILTNAGNFSARVTIGQAPSLEQPHPLEGELLVRGAHLLFAPIPSEDEEKQLSIGRFSFVWDVASNSGFVLSEGLQAYAPVTGKTHPTNLVFQAGTAAGREVSGMVDALVQMSDGTTVLFRVTRAASPPGFPVHITAVTNSPLLDLTLSKIRPGIVPSDIFSPPAGFARYPSPEAMADELALRHQNLRRSRPQPWEQP